MHSRDRNSTDTSLSIRLSELALKLGARFDGIGHDPLINEVASIESSRPGSITFLSDLKKHAQHLASLQLCKASAVIASEKAGPLPLPAIRFENAHFGLMQTLKFFQSGKATCTGIHPTAFVHENAEVSPSASVGPLSVISENAEIADNARIDAQCFVGENSVIGENTLLHPGVRLLENCRIGKNCIIHAGTVIGSDGFGFFSNAEGHHKIPQIGSVIIEDDVEIGANVTIDRATLDTTYIGSGTKIDNLVHIAHNVSIGRNCIIVAQVGISGTTTIEDNVTLAGQSGTVGHVTIGKGSTVAARGVVTQDIKPGSTVSGFPIKPHSEEKRIMTALRKLPELILRLREVEKYIAER